jgi:hypothetical protein
MDASSIEASCSSIPATPFSLPIVPARSPSGAGAEAMLGFSRAQALGASLDLIIPAHLRERHWAGFAGVISSGVSPSPAWVKTPVLHADGTVARMAITVVLLKQGASACGVLAILSPL